MDIEHLHLNNDDFFADESQRLLERIAKLQKEISREKLNQSRESGRSGSPGPRAVENVNLISVNRSDDDEQLRYLKDENEKLKRELSEARGYIRELSEKNRRLFPESRRAADAQAEATLLKQQLHAIRTTIDKLPADELTSRVRIEVLEERLQDMQRQNFDLRRQLAGMTPDRKKVLGENLDPNCERCVAVLKQKALQTKYIVAQATENRRQVEELRKECQKVKDDNEALLVKNSEMEAKYEKELKDTKEHRDLYKRNSERAAKWYKTQLEGFTQDINRLKSKVVDLEKYLVKAQWNADADLKQQELIEELKKITVEAASVANQVKRWRNVYE